MKSLRIAQARMIPTRPWTLRRHSKVLKSSHGELRVRLTRMNQTGREGGMGTQKVLKSAQIVSRWMASSAHENDRDRA